MQSINFYQDKKKAMEYLQNDLEKALKIADDYNYHIRDLTTELLATLLLEHNENKYKQN